MKRLIIVVLTAVMVLSCVGAETVEELYAKVKESSTEFKEMQVSRRNEFLDSVLSALKGPSWSVSLQGAGIKAQDNTLLNPSISLPSFEVGYTTPERDDQLAFEARLTLIGQDYSWDPDKNSYKLGDTSVSLKGGLSKTFEFKSWDDTNYSKGLSDLQRTNNYEISVLQFENTFLENVIKILEWQKDLSQKSIAKTRAEKAYNDAISSGKIKEGSPEEIQKKADVEVANTEYNQVKETGTEYLTDFKKTYGIDFPEAIEAPTLYELSYEPTVGGNTDVVSKYADYMTAKQRIDEKVGKSSKISLNTSLEPKVSFSENMGYKNSSLNTSLSATYSSGNLSVDMTLNSDFTLNPDKTSEISGPSFTVSASWSSTPSLLSKVEMERLRMQYPDKNEYERVLRELNNESLRKESLEIEKLESEMLSAEKDWQKELAQYITKANELKEEIREFKNNYEVLTIKAEANEKALKQTDKSSEEYLSALAATYSTKYDLTLANIKSHILFNKVQIIEK